MSEDTDFEKALATELDPQDGSEKVSAFLRRMAEHQDLARVRVVEQPAQADLDRMRRIATLFDKNERHLQEKKKRGHARPDETDVEFLTRLMSRPSWVKDNPRLRRMIEHLNRVEWADAVIDGNLGPMALFMRDVARRLDKEKDRKLRAQAVRVADRIDEAGSFVDTKRLLEDIKPKSHGYAKPPENDIEFLMRLANRPSWAKDSPRLYRIIGLLKRIEWADAVINGNLGPLAVFCRDVARRLPKKDHKLRAQAVRVAERIQKAGSFVDAKRLFDDDLNIKPSEGGQTIGTADWAMVALAIRDRLPAGVGLYTRDTKDDGGSRVIMADASIKNLTTDNALAVEQLVTAFAERMRTLIGGPVGTMVERVKAQIAAEIEKQKANPADVPLIAAEGEHEGVLPELCEETNTVEVARMDDLQIAAYAESIGQPYIGLLGASGRLGEAATEAATAMQGTASETRRIAAYGGDSQAAAYAATHAAAAAAGVSVTDAGPTVGEAVREAGKRFVNKTWTDDGAKARASRSKIVDAAPPTVVMTKVKPPRRFTSLAEFEYERGGVIKIGSKVHAAVAVHFLDGAGEFYVEKLAFYDEEANYDDAKETAVGRSLGKLGTALAKTQDAALKAKEEEKAKDCSGLAATPGFKPDGEQNIKTLDSDWQCEGQCRSWNSNRSTCSVMSVRKHCPYCGTHRPSALQFGQVMSGKIVADKSTLLAFGTLQPTEAVATGEPGKIVHASKAMLNGKPYTPKDPVQEAACAIWNADGFGDPNPFE